MRTLVIDTATAACSVALIDGGAIDGEAIHAGTIVARDTSLVGRGHAERLLPMIAALPGGGRADRILVDCGPGSFTGLRVGIAAARALGFGWSVPVSGYSSLALLAAAALRDPRTLPASELAVVIEGGHGEVFMQTFAYPLAVISDLRSLNPADALAALGGMRAIGTGTRWLHALDDTVFLDETLPDAAHAHLLPATFTDLAPRPIYGRAPDAKPMAIPA